jgi:hypothetical protein
MMMRETDLVAGRNRTEDSRAREQHERLIDSRLKLTRPKHAGI